MCVFAHVFFYTNREQRGCNLFEPRVKPLSVPRHLDLSPAS